MWRTYLFLHELSPHPSLPVHSTGRMMQCPKRRRGTSPSNVLSSIASVSAARARRTTSSVGLRTTMWRCMVASAARQLAAVSSIAWGTDAPIPTVDSHLQLTTLQFPFGELQVSAAGLIKPCRHPASAYLSKTLYPAHCITRTLTSLAHGILPRGACVRTWTSTLGSLSGAARIPRRLPPKHLSGLLLLGQVLRPSTRPRRLLYCLYSRDPA